MLRLVLQKEALRLVTNGKHEVFVGVEDIFKANWAAPPAGEVLRLVLQTFYPQEAANATFE